MSRDDKLASGWGLILFWIVFSLVGIPVVGGAAAVGAAAFLVSGYRTPKLDASSNAATAESHRVQADALHRPSGVPTSTDPPLSDSPYASLPAGEAVMHASPVGRLLHRELTAGLAAVTLLAVGVIAGAGWVGYSAYAANGEGERCTRLERSIESVIYNSGGADITLLSESNLLDWLVENRTKYEDAVDELYSRQLPSDSVERQTALLEREITMDRIDERLIEWGRNETPRLLAATGCA